MGLAETITPQLSERLALRLGVSAGTGYALAAVLALAAAFLGAFLFQRLLARSLRAFASRTTTKLDDVLAEATRGPVYLFAFLVGVSVAVLLTPAPDAVRAWAPRTLVVLTLSAVVVFGARIASGLLSVYDGPAVRSLIVRALVSRLLVIAIYAIGFLFILDNLGLSITPLLTTLGLAGLAVALALQDTLANFFAGLWVQADRPLDVGHYVRIDNVEGFVTQVGWRTTKLRTLPNNHVVIPNSRVASSVVVDYDLPTSDMGVSIEMKLAPDIDTREVERILLEEGRRGVREIAGALETPEPFVRFNGYSESGLDFALLLRVRSFLDQYAVLHEMRHRVHARLRSEGIRLSFPIRISRGPLGDD